MSDNCGGCGRSRWVHYMDARRNGWLFCDPDGESIGTFPLEIVADTYRIAGRKVPRRLEDALRHEQLTMNTDELGGLTSP